MRIGACQPAIVITTNQPVEEKEGPVEDLCSFIRLAGGFGVFPAPPPEIPSAPIHDNEDVKRTHDFLVAFRSPMVLGIGIY